MAERPHVVVLHRWADRYAHYERYVDHATHAVTYVTTEVGTAAVPATAAEVRLVEATDDPVAVGAGIRRLAAAYGPPAAIVALKEDDLLVAARLRTAWGCPGPSAAELLPFRDKLVMSEAVAAAGVPAPAFAAASGAAAVRSFAERHGWPVVLKPRIGSSSEGVRVLSGPADVAAVDFPAAGMLVQAFDARTIHHVDGLFDGRAVGPFRVSRYVNTCLGFRDGDVLGSVEVDDRELTTAIGAFAGRALRALSDGPQVFHLEVFADAATGECAFLEVGARVGGAEIPFLWREVHGHDLMRAGFELAMGRPAPRDPVPPEFGAEVGGWLLVPAPAERPCRITEVTPMAGRAPGPYAESLLSPGDVLPAADAYYEHVGGRFRFRGATSARVEAAIAATARDFRVGAEALQPART